MPDLAPSPAKTAARTAGERDSSIAALAERLGGIPRSRIRRTPAPGTATVRDVERLNGLGGGPYELVDGTLVEKAVSEETGFLDSEMAGVLRDWVKPRGLGWTVGPSGFVRLFGGTLLRAPDASFIRRDQRPNGLASRGYSDGAPALCVEVVSPDNTRAEMERKRTEYFANGCELCWTVYPRTRTIEVHTPADSPDGTGPADGAGVVLTDADTLTGDPVLPGFAASVADIFDAPELGDG